MDNLFDKVKELRNRTGIGIVECKKALLASDNDLDKAIVFLRKSGIINSESRSMKNSKEGIIYSKITSDKHTAIIIELNCETDFVARSDYFLEYAQYVCDFYLSSKDFPDRFFFDKNIILPKPLEDAKTDLYLKVKENIFINKIRKFYSVDSYLYNYIHFDNKLGAILELNNDIPSLALDILIQIVAMNPKYLSISDIPLELINNERLIIFDKFKNQYPDKSDFLLNKMVDGQINKFYKSNVLLEQSFVKDLKISISDHIKNIVNINLFFRLCLGE